MPVKHLHVDLFGTLCNGAEEWSAGFAMQPLTSGTPDLNAMALEALTVFGAQYWNTGDVNGSTPTATALEGARATSIDATGHVDGAAVAILSTPSAGSAGSGAVAMPPQCSVVASLVTPIATRRGRGRMYLPAPANAFLTSTGRLATTTRDAWLTKFQDFINAVNADPVLRTVGVASSVGGFVTSVTEVKIGNVIDTQRRRRDRLPESYAVGAITI